MLVVETAVAGDVRLQMKLISLVRSALLNERRLIWPQTSKNVFFAPSTDLFLAFFVYVGFLHPSAAFFKHLIVLHAM